MEYTTLSQICALWLVSAFIWGKISIGMNIGKRFGDIKVAPWRFSTGFVFLQLVIGIFILVGTGFFYEWRWPQYTYAVFTGLGFLILLPAMILVRGGAADDYTINYGFNDFFGDVCMITLLYFGHAYGPLGLNPWP
jgi:hypothetical protein